MAVAQGPPGLRRTPWQAPFANSFVCMDFRRRWRICGRLFFALVAFTRGGPALGRRGLLAAGRVSIGVLRLKHSETSGLWRWGG